MAKYKVTNTSNIRKYTYGHQLEPGETKEIDVLVKEAEEIPQESFHVERLDEPGNDSQAEEESTQVDGEDQNPDNQNQERGE